MPVAGDCQGARSTGQVWQRCLLGFSVHSCPAHRYCPTSSDPKGGNPMQAQDQARFGRVVQAGETYEGKQGPNYTPGVSVATVGSRALWLGSVVLPPRGRSKAHVHENHESAFYLISGEEVEQIGRASCRERV